MCRSYIPNELFTGNRQNLNLNISDPSSPCRYLVGLQFELRARCKDFLHTYRVTWSLLVSAWHKHIQVDDNIQRQIKNRTLIEQGISLKKVNESINIQERPYLIADRRGGGFLPFSNVVK
jgi:hypothetical protein